MSSYESQLSNLSIYRKFPELLPWVGNNYVSKNHKKLLIVAESPYLPENSTINLNAEKWYSDTKIELTKKESTWINIRGVVEYATENNFNLKGHTTLLQIHKALGDTGIVSGKTEKPEHRLFNEVAYMNYFLRPAKTGQSIKQIACDLDYTTAYAYFSKVIDILVPDLIIFAGKLGIDSAEKKELWKKTNDMKTYYTYINHPSSSWWNRSTRPKFFKGKTSKQHFIDFLTENRFIN